jgi:hypothetical protein
MLLMVYEWASIEQYHYLGLPSKYQTYDPPEAM